MLGIPQSFSEEVFQPFRQADTSHTRQHNGAGLGLAICKQLVTLMQGTIAFQSEEGLGTVFTIRLPVHEMIASVVRPTKTNLPPPRKRIAIFSRHTRGFELLKSVLTERGFKVVNSFGSSTIGDAELIWADSDVFARTPGLSSLTNTNTPLFIAYNETEAMDPATMGHNVIGVKRPVILHVVDRLLRDTKLMRLESKETTVDERQPLAGKRPVAKIRDSGIGVSDVPLDMARERNDAGNSGLSARVSESDQAAIKGSILLVEDNVVGTRMMGHFHVYS